MGLWEHSSKFSGISDNKLKNTIILFVKWQRKVQLLDFNYGNSRVFSSSLSAC